MSGVAPVSSEADRLLPHRAILGMGAKTLEVDVLHPTGLSPSGG